MRAQFGPYKMSLCKLCGLSVIFSDHLGVVQALNKDEVGCSSAGHKDAGLWMSGPKQHTTLEEKAKMTPENRQVAWSNEKADELPKTEAIQDGAAVAERVGKEAMDMRTMVHAGTRTAATFLEGVEELVDMEEISEESNKKR